MEQQPEAVEKLPDKRNNGHQRSAITPSNHSGTRGAVLGQVQAAQCSNCGASTGSNTDDAMMTNPSYVYALGKIKHRFPSISVEKEFAQAIGRADTAGLTDEQAFASALSERSNRYLARHLCWVLSIADLDTYILQPNDPADYDLLIEAIRPEPSTDDVDVIIGIRGPLAPAAMCNGLVVPIVVFDQIYSFNTISLVKSIPRPEAISPEAFERASDGLFRRIIQLTDNAGATDEHRALNYLAVRYPRIYERIAQAYADVQSLTEVEVRPSRLSGVRNVVDAIFSYTHRETAVTEKWFVRVDVTEEFPFLVTGLQPFFDR